MTTTIVSSFADGVVVHHLAEGGATAREPSVSDRRELAWRTTASAWARVLTCGTCTRRRRGRARVMMDGSGSARG
jgi:hypothetical protein